MAAILTPGYLRWDGTKYVLDQDVEIVGPEGDAGPTGGTGPQGVPGIGVGATAVGDLTGTYPNPISVVGLTGVSGVVSFGSTVTNPTITQTTTAGATGQPITIKGQNAATTGGNAILQSGTGTTAGLVQFLVGNTTVGYFDTSLALRLSSNAASTIAWISQTLPVTNATSLYSYTSAVNNQAVIATGSAAGEAVVDLISTSGGSSGGRLIASGPSDAITGWASNFIIEQIGSATSALLFSKATNSGSGRVTLSRLYQSGALALGDTATNNTSTLAQAGLTGAVLNLGAATGTFTSAANQALNFNIAGAHHVQGHTEVRFDVGANLAGYFDVNRTFRSGVSAATNATILNVSVPTSTDTGYSYNASGDVQWRMISGAASTVGSVEAWNSSAGGGTSVGMTFKAAGASHSVADWQSNGIIEQIGSTTSSLVFSKLDGAGLNRATTGRIYASGAWGLGSTATNNTSALAQAGLTGPLMNISATTGGTMTSAANQMLLFNVAGAAHVQGHTDVRFDVGANLAGYFDANRALRVGQTPATTSSLYGATFPTAGDNSIYACNTSGHSTITNFCQSTNFAATIAAFNTALGGANSNGITLYASGSSFTPLYAGHGVLEQTGGSTSALGFAKVQGDGSNRGMLARLYQTGALGLGDTATNNTSTLAQAGLTGPVINLSSTSGGSLTTNTNQALLFNSSGNMNVQGNVSVGLFASTTSVATATANKFTTNVGRRVKLITTTTSYSVLATDEVVSVGTLAAPINVTLPGSPTAGDTYVVKDANGSAAAFNISVLGNGNNIDTAATFTLSTNYATLTVVYNGSKWISV